MRAQILPALQTVGALYPHTLILELPLHSRAALQESLAGGRDDQPLRVYAHELHHWFDIVGTIWGQRYLDLVFLALDGVSAAASEDAAYPEVLRLFDADREILFPSYYKYVLPGAPHGTVEQWRNRWSVGHRIKSDGTPDQSHPILFVRFETDGAAFARQPLSVGALLELRAMAAEDAAFVAFAQSLGIDEAVVERAIRQQDLRFHLYDPLLTTYSAATHVLATNSGQGATGPVFAWGAAAADLCLNIEPAVLRRLAVPPRLGEIHHNAVHGFRSRADAGFVYACLVSWLRENRATTMNQAGLTAAFIRIGLPPPAEIWRNAERLMTRMPLPRLQCERLRTIRKKLRDAGDILMAKRAQLAGLFPQSKWQDLPAPMVMTKDCEQFHLGQAVVTVEDSEWLHDLQINLDRATHQALRAARGLDFMYTDFVY